MASLFLQKQLAFDPVPPDSQCSLALPPLSLLSSPWVRLQWLTPAQVVVNIGVVATISKNTNDALVPLSISSTPAQVRNIGTSLVNSFNLIINNLNGDVTAMNETPAFDDDAAQDVVDALTTFIVIHQTLLGTVIGKHSFFAQFGVTGPVLAVLRSLETAVDAFAFSLIALVPTRTTTVQTGTGQLGGTLTNIENTYKQICVPSPLYPIVMPVCVAI